MAYYLDIELITRGDVDETWTYERYKAMCLARRIAILISQERWDLAQE